MALQTLHVAKQHMALQTLRVAKQHMALHTQRMALLTAADASITQAAPPHFLPRSKSAAANRAKEQVRVC